MVTGCTGAASLLARSTALLIVAAATGGCSFFMPTAPSDPVQRTRKAAVACKSATHYPIVDTISAAVGVYNIGVSLVARDRVLIYGQEASKKTGLTLGITQAVLFGLGATYGYVQVARCRELGRERGLEAKPRPAPSGDWHAKPRARGNGATGDSTGQGSRTGGRTASAGSAPGTEDDFPRGTAPGTEDAVSAELPPWSAFRRYPLAPEHPPRAPATGGK
jgi:tetrahydromethanopterin S-methyltransferase subunit F